MVDISTSNSNKKAKLTFQTNIHATSKDIWKMYVDLNKRRQWETDLEYIKLNGDFSTGTSGVIKLIDRPEMPYRLTSVVPYESYWDRTEIPGKGLALCFGHEFTMIDDGTLVKISAELERSTGEITDQDILFLAQVFSDTPQSILAIKNLLNSPGSIF
jgi:hypothetical protein